MKHLTLGFAFFFFLFVSSASAQEKPRWKEDMPLNQDFPPTLNNPLKPLTEKEFLHNYKKALEPYQNSIGKVEIHPNGMPIHEAKGNYKIRIAQFENQVEYKMLRIEPRKNVSD